MRLSGGLFAGSLDVGKNMPVDFALFVEVRMRIGSQGYGHRELLRAIDSL